MKPKTQEEKFYGIASRSLFALSMSINPIQLSAIAMLDDYDQVDQELEQLMATIDELKERFDKREDELSEVRRNG